MFFTSFVGIQGRVVKKAMHGNRVTSRPTPRGLPATPGGYI